MVQGCVYQATELVDVNAGVGQITSPNGLRLQQRKIVIVGEGYYAPPTLLMEDGTRQRRCILILPFARYTIRAIRFYSASACMQVPCISYGKGVRPSVCSRVCMSVCRTLRFYQHDAS